MLNTKNKYQEYYMLLLPSSLSIVFCVFLALADMVLNQFESVKRVLQLPHSFDLWHIMTGWANDILIKTIGVNRTDVLVVGTFWGVVGLLVYVALRALARFFIEVDDDVSVRHFIWPKGADRTLPLRTLAVHTAFSVFAFIILVFITFGPLATVLRGPVFAGALGSNKAVQDIVWFITSVLMWHIFTIVLRLTVRRPRIFG
jgi:hypothetical protein